MKLAFLGLTAEQRGRAIEEAAARQGVSPVIIEKDFWVCFALSLLYRSEFGESLVFKGGTSL
jgi:predicted nucleotidyltransferase component of viral defense system